MNENLELWQKYGGRFWVCTPAELERLFKVPIEEESALPNLAAISLETEYQIEKFSMLYYFNNASIGILSVTIASSLFFLGISFKTFLLFLCTYFVSSIVFRIIVVVIIWPLECHYRRTIGQFHDGKFTARDYSASYAHIDAIRIISPVLIGFLVTLLIQRFFI